MAARRILLDTDIGSDVDDAIALGLILASPEALSLEAITTVAGDTQTRSRVAARYLGLAGRQDVPIHVGEKEALLRPGRFNGFGHEAVGLLDGPDAPIADEPAPEAIVRLAREVPELEIVLIGPLTNLARALALDPGLPDRVAGITIMGGHIREVRIGSRVFPPGIDYNLCSDPEASVCVLGAGFRTTLVTADVTLRTWLREDDLPRLARGGEVARCLVSEVEVWAPFQRRLFAGLGATLAPENVAFLHDPLTVQSLVDPAPLSFEALHIVPTIERGVLRTLEAPTASGAGTPMRVATAVDAEAAHDAIVARLAAL